MQVEINLLPWRELKREQARKQWITELLSSFISIGILVFIAHSYFVGKKEMQLARNQRLQTEISHYQRQIKEMNRLQILQEALFVKIQFIQHLQTTRVFTVKLFDELINILPDEMVLTRIERVSNKVILQGVTGSFSEISNLMHQMEKSRWIQKTALVEIKKSSKNEYTAESEFKLNFIFNPE